MSKLPALLVDMDKLKLKQDKTQAELSIVVMAGSSMLCDYTQQKQPNWKLKTRPKQF